MAEIILAAGTDPCVWPEVVTRFAEHWPGIRGVTLLMHSHDTEGQACDGFIQHGFHAADLREYERHYSRINPWVPLMQRDRSFRPVLTNASLPWRRIAGTEFYNDFLKRQGECECAAGLKLFDGADRSAFLSVSYGSAAAEGCDGAMMHVLGRLAPVFGAAVALNRAVADRAAAIAGHAFEALSIPALVIDGAGAVRSANALAGAALEKGDLLRLDSAGRLRLCDRAAGARLRQAFRPPSWTDNAAAGEIALRSPDGRKCAIMALFPIGGAGLGTNHLGGFFAPDRLALVTLRTLNGEPVLSPQALRQLFGLTGAEARLAMRLARGESLNEAAEILGIARETARVHLRAAFAKTGTHRQAELVALIAGLARVG